MKRKEEYFYFLRNLRQLSENISNNERELLKENLLSLLKADRTLVLTIIRNGEFYDKMAKRKSCYNLNDIFDMELRSYKIPTYIEVIQLIKQNKNLEIV